MKTLYGDPLTRDFLSRRVGHMSQIAGARAYALTSGPARGVEAVDVRTGTGFEFTVLPGRGLDIAWASYKGTPIGYISKAGVRSAAHFVEDGATGFLRNFTAGLLTTAGLSNIGVPCEAGGVAYGLHGRIGNIEAEDVSIWQGWDGDDYKICVAGRMRQAQPFGENLSLRREVRCKLGESLLTISDVLANEGSTSEPVLLLYHCNFGYPIVGPRTRLIASRGRVEAREGTSPDTLATHAVFDDPIPGYQERCYYHHPREGDETAHACLFNDALGLGAYVRYRTDALPMLVEWKMMGEQDYVVGLEPSTCRLDGRAAVMARGEAKMIEPGETRRFSVEIGVVESESALGAL